MKFLIIPEYDITSTPDTNMNTAYSWANKLADLSHLRMTLDINQRIQLILDIEGEVGCYIKYDLRWSGLFENLRPLKKFSLIGLMIWLDITSLMSARMKNTEKIDKGMQLRQDDFFSQQPGRSSAEEIVEGVLLAAQREYEVII
jgi:hypothetical protein